MTKRGKLYLLIAAALLVLSSVVCGGGGDTAVRGTIVEKGYAAGSNFDDDAGPFVILTGGKKVQVSNDVASVVIIGDTCIFSDFHYHYAQTVECNND
jgi:hypothetical protein